MQNKQTNKTTFLKSNSYSPLENARHLPVSEKRDAGLMEPATQTSEKNVRSPWGRGQAALPSQIEKGINNCIRCEGSCLTILPVRQKEQVDRCHFCAKLKLPHKRERGPELEKGLKSKDSRVQCNYEGIHSTAACRGIPMSSTMVTEETNISGR